MKNIKKTIVLLFSVLLLTSCFGPEKDGSLANHRKSGDMVIVEKVYESSDSLCWYGFVVYEYSKYNHTSGRKITNKAYWFVGGIDDYRLGEKINK